MFAIFFVLIRTKILKTKTNTHIYLCTFILFTFLKIHKSESYSVITVKIKNINERKKNIHRVFFYIILCLVK